MANAKAVTPVVTLSASTYTYDGKVKTPAVTVKDGNTVLKKDVDYTVFYAGERKNAGSYLVAAMLKGSYSGAASKTFKVDKAANPLKVKAKTATVKYSKVKKKAQRLAVTRVIAFSKKGQGKLTYVKTSGSKYIGVNKGTGKVTVGKGLKKGVYKVGVKIKAAGNDNYKASAVKKVAFRVRVK